LRAYTSFAEVYDSFMDNVPYELWKEQTINLLHKEGIDSGIVTELGCGTGTLTQLLAKSGYDMIGIDISEDMLNMALRKKDESKLDILYLCQDMTEFELYGSCRAFISRCDSINYILKYKDLLKMFKLVNVYLDNEGVFIFDCNTIYKYKEVLADKTFAYTKDIGSFIWENAYYSSKFLNQYDVTFYVKDSEDEVFHRFEETHIQRAYSLEELKKAALKAGLKWKYILDADTNKAIKAKTERYLVCLGK
jgi:hypothetical protein